MASRNRVYQEYQLALPPVVSKRTYRELNLLEHIEHENRRLHLVTRRSLLEEMIYFVTKLLATDLDRLLTSRPLKKHIQYFLYQSLRGLKYVDSVGVVVHRKPSIILTNENCDLKTRLPDDRLCLQPVPRAPEIMRTWPKYDVAVDVRSTGCIFAAHRRHRADGEVMTSDKHADKLDEVDDTRGRPAMLNDMFQKDDMSATFDRCRQARSRCFVGEQREVIIFPTI
ncbi:hypothetical protein L226DRAFT_521841 [Lentinus tigrinus ALCF2SS1-7]|uniref:uncharacterized protein n=1 Tax=Lentinus tigrinus ALCF2SS1-7 TaxID=1328758 RepID=UPI001165F92B|nr:hypothetical protein L226DRAFT_521841 [Lentinus tigrinus ALCF2SS1-7]